MFESRTFESQTYWVRDLGWPIDATLCVGQVCAAYCPGLTTGLVMKRVLVSDCHAQGNGGAVALFTSYALLTDTSIVGCSASKDAGALLVRMASTVTLLTSHIVNCSTHSGSGGAIIVSS